LDDIEYARRLHQIDDKSKKQQSLGSDEDLARRMAMQQNEMKRQMNTQLQADEELAQKMRADLMRQQSEQEFSDWVSNNLHMHCWKVS
jgi:hypothetical protein